MTSFVRLKNRSLISLKGKDRVSFLQGMVTNDVTRAGKNEGIYALMLNPQGRFLYEFFIVEYGDSLLLEVDANVVDDLVKKLNFYKLRAEVIIERYDDFEILFFEDYQFSMRFSGVNLVYFKDPRKEKFGLRCYFEKGEVLEKTLRLEELVERPIEFYHHLRLKNKIVDENDLSFNESIIVEYGFDNFRAIDYKKGCYVGQEVVARAHYRGVSRKNVYLVKILGLGKIVKNSEITWKSKKQGIVLSSLFYERRLIALALIKNVNALGKEIDVKNLDLEVCDKKLVIKS